jgi:cation diffusion facilitator family transporter
MAEPESPTQIYAAVAANLVIAVCKLIAAAVTGSSAMLSEGVHSAADTGNQLLMLLGLKRSRRPADSVHPFGNGQEVYFWSFVVAMILFSGGGILSVYEGIRRLKYGEGLSDPFWNYIVLAIAAASEGISMYFALSKFRQSIRPGEHWWDSLRTSKDPSVFTVLAEDAAALIGIVVAFLGILLEQMTGSVVPDAVAAMMIGGILCVVAVLLAIETHALLLGESADPEIVSGIHKIIEADRNVANAHHPLTMHFGPNEVLVNIAVEFRSGTSSDVILNSIKNFEATILAKFPTVRRIFIEIESPEMPERQTPAA